MLNPETDLSLTRQLNAPASLLWRCWTTPTHIKQFFIPKPHKITSCEMDLRPGGRFNTTFEVEGQSIENQGVILEVVEGKRLVFTDLFTEGWSPNPEPFMTAIIELEPVSDAKTTYTATVRHLTGAARQQHEEMGFHAGWGEVAAQLETYAASLI